MQLERKDMLPCHNNNGSHSSLKTIYTKESTHIYKIRPAVAA